MRDLIMEFLFAFRRFFIIGSDGYTRYSDHYKFEEKLNTELKERSK